MIEDELRILRAIKSAAPDGGVVPLKLVVENSGLPEGRVLRLAQHLQDQQLIMMSVNGSMELTPFGEGEV
jgi:RIO-like serine/threonine protein kinase